MTELHIDYARKTGPIKPMHAVNNGPLQTQPNRGNLTTYQAAGIPYARTHDASFCGAYGGEHTVDVHAIFPDFKADPLDPDSYDFAVTDVYLATILHAGTQIFYRLGSKIENTVKKYGTVPPPDFLKWAVICEHIILHYNEGWANGFHYRIQYWEIWNEADLSADNPNPSTWGGTPEEFFEFYRVAATYLKSRFPDLKIGGPSLAFRVDGWLDSFFKAITTGSRVPLDFFSWHIYTTEPDKIRKRAMLIREKLDRFGYCQTESILNEWNYLISWEQAVKTFRTVVSMKGAAFTAACMCVSQNTFVDMLMYYDARPCAFNGLFDSISLEPIKGYYPFLMFSELYRRKNQVFSDWEDPDIYSVSAVDDNGSPATMICYYTDSDDMPDKTLTLTLDGLTGKSLDCYRLDEHSDLLKTGSLVPDQASDRYSLRLSPNTAVLLK